MHSGTHLNGTVLYIAARLPALSETFVYNEVLALRDRGVSVPVASVFPPAERLGSTRLEELAREATPIYGPGPLRLLVDALLEALRHPLRAAYAAATALRDMLLAHDLSMLRRAKLISDRRRVDHAWPLRRVRSCASRVATAA